MEIPKIILGRTYEYCLSKFAEAEGKLAGEFYTPACIVKHLLNSEALITAEYMTLLADLVECSSVCQIHRKASGNIKDISVYGQDSNPTTWKMAQMNLAIRGIEADLGKFNADTFF